MKKLFFKILLILNLLFVILLLVSSLAEYINPVKAWQFAFLGLAYPFFLIVNLIFLITWIFIKRRYALLSFFSILLTWGQLHKFFQINIKQEVIPEKVSSVRLLSYNVRLFNYYQWLKDKTIPEKIINFIQNEKAGIVCLQEFIAVANSNLSLSSLKKSLSNTSYSHVNFSYKITENRYLGIATFSHYPIVNKGVIKFQQSPNIIIFSDIKINTDTIRVYNCHLQSTRIRKDEYHILDSILLNYSNKHLSKFKNLTIRLREAYKKRANQAAILSYHIKNSPYPVIISGDFNDTPVSYTYNKVKGELKDAYLESGKGIGNTYFGNFPSFRIDYIFHSPEIKTYGFETKKIEWSDHYPIECNFILPER